MLQQMGCSQPVMRWVQLAALAGGRGPLQLATTKYGQKGGLLGGSWQWGQQRQAGIYGTGGPVVEGSCPVVALTPRWGHVSTCQHVVHVLVEDIVRQGVHV